MKFIISILLSNNNLYKFPLYFFKYQYLYSSRQLLTFNLFFFPLAVTVPPQKPNIIDERGKTVPAVAGPYEEGGDMRLQCLVSGGKSYFL